MFDIDKDGLISFEESGSVPYYLGLKEGTRWRLQSNDKNLQRWKQWLPIGMQKISESKKSKSIATTHKFLR